MEVKVRAKWQVPGEEKKLGTAESVDDVLKERFVANIQQYLDLMVMGKPAEIDEVILVIK